MKRSCITSCATVAGFLGALLWLGSPSDPINPVIGDQSFVATFGRPPTDDDPNRLRVRTHLAYVEGLLRAIADGDLPVDLRAARRRNLDLLQRYWQAELFPAGENPARRQPTFIDDDGRRCAVAALVEASAGTAIVDRINRRFRNATIGEMDDPALDAWIASSGLTRREVMMIQPNYEGGRESWHVDLRQFVATARASFLDRFAGDRAPGAERIASFGLAGQVIDLEHRWLLGAKGDVGGTFAGHTYYDASLRAGALLWAEGGVAIDGHQPLHSHHTVLIVTAGAGVEGITDVLSTGATLPIGLLLSFDTMNIRDYADMFHERQPWPIVQLRAEGAWVFRGQPGELAWSGALDLAWDLSRWNDLNAQRFIPRSLLVSLTVKEISGVIYGGVALGLGAWSVGEEEESRRRHGLSIPSKPLRGPYW